MNWEKVNQLAEEYVKRKDEATFEAIHDELSGYMRRMAKSCYEKAKYTAAFDSMIDEEDIEQEFRITLYEVLNKYDGFSNFADLIKGAFRKSLAKVIRYYRQEKRSRKREDDELPKVISLDECLPDDDECDYAELIPDSTNIEEEVVSKTVKAEALTLVMGARGERSATALELRVMGCDYEQIGEVLGVTPTYARQLVSRSQRFLRNTDLFKAFVA